MIMVAAKSKICSQQAVAPGEPMVPFQPEHQQAWDPIRADASLVWVQRQEKSDAPANSSQAGGPQPFVPCRPSTDWMRPTALARKTYFT